MNILHICPSFNNPLYAEIVERQLVNNNIRVFYFRGKKEGLPNGEKEYVDGVMPYNNIDRFFFKIKEKKILKKFFGLYKPDEFDICHAHTLFVSGYIALQAKKKWGLKYIVAVRGTDINLFFRYRYNLRKIGIEILCNAEKIIFMSNCHKIEVFEKYIPTQFKEELSEKSVVKYNGINNFWLKENKSAKHLRKNEILSLIYYGDINKNKNLELTMKVVEKFISEGQNVEFTVIGRILDRKYEEIFKCKRYIKYIEFKPKEELIHYLRNADIFIMPSLSETFGLSYIEAMSQGIPIIYTRGQGIDGVFEEGTVGYHVNPHDIEETYNAIKRVLSDYEKFSNACIEESKQFSWDVIVDDYQKIYDSLLSKKINHKLL